MKTKNKQSKPNSTSGDFDAPPSRAFKRTLLGTPAALVVTAALGLLMAGMIRVEYEALAEKPAKLSFVINEEVPDIIVKPEIDRPELTEITPPPPAPKIDIPRTGLPGTEIVVIDTLPPDPPKPIVDLAASIINVGDADPQPILRVPPQMPPRFAEGNNSGRCNVRFDVSAEGSPYNVVTTYCSSDLLKKATVRSVLKWKFRPKIQNGQPVAMTGLENEVVYQLLDNRGKLLPEI